MELSVPIRFMPSRCDSPPERFNRRREPSASALTSHNNRWLRRSSGHAQEPLSSTAHRPAAPKACALPLGHNPSLAMIRERLQSSVAELVDAGSWHPGADGRCRRRGGRGRGTDPARGAA